MTAITINLPDHLARDVAYQTSINPSWIKTVLREALWKTSPAWKPAPPAEAAGDDAGEDEDPETVSRRQQEAIDWLCGCLADSKRTVDDFLAECHADKERELAADRRADERRRREGSACYALR